jgi:hypothetical protein
MLIRKNKNLQKIIGINLIMSLRLFKLITKIKKLV